MRDIIKIGILISVVLLFSGCMNNNGKGSLKDGGVANVSNPLYDPDYYYEIDTWGTNADVFEFTPKGNPNYICINIGGNSRALQCIPKGK